MDEETKHNDPDPSNPIEVSTIHPEDIDLDTDNSGTVQEHVDANDPEGGDTLETETPDE